MLIKTDLDSRWMLIQSVKRLLVSNSLLTFLSQADELHCKSTFEEMENKELPCGEKLSDCCLLIKPLCELNTNQPCKLSNKIDNQSPVFSLAQSRSELGAPAKNLK